MKRKTTQRDAIREVLQHVDHPLGVEDILKAGRGLVESLNLATVYRNLKLLIQNGFIRKISHPVLGPLYEKIGQDHHHHFHCRICERVLNLPGCALDEKGATPPGFVTEGHEVFLFGVCPACRQ